MTALRAKPTQSLLAKTKRLAKARSRESDLPHSECLELEAAAAGYAGWHDLQQACATPNKGEFTLLVDPKLPPLFDSTPNEQRSKRHLDIWWDKPFAISNPGGGFTVRCLDGGAWDRSTWYGAAKTLEEAGQLALAKLESWRGFRDRPMTATGDGVKVVRMPGRPDKEVEILYRAKDVEDADRWLRENFPNLPR